MQLYNGIGWEIARINKRLEEADDIPITPLDKQDLKAIKDKLKEMNKDALKAIKAVERYQAQEQTAPDSKKKDSSSTKPAGRGFPRVQLGGVMFGKNNK